MMKPADPRPDLSFETRYQVCGGKYSDRSYEDFSDHEIDMIAFIFAPTGLSSVFRRVEQQVTRAIWNCLMTGEADG